MNKENLADFRQQAHRITMTGKPAKMVWSELNNWASKKGPLAMKSAVIEFVNAYRGSSDLSVLMPELMRSHTFSPYEKKAFIELAGHKLNLTESQQTQLRPNLLMPVSISKPDLALFLNPKSGGSVLRSEFTQDPRDSIFSFKEKISFDKPKMVEGRLNQFNPDTIQSHSMPFESSNGLSLLRNLVENVKSQNALPIPKLTVKRATKVAVKSKPKKLVVKKSKISAKTRRKTTKLQIKSRISKTIRKKTKRR